MDINKGFNPSCCICYAFAYPYKIITIIIIADIHRLYLPCKVGGHGLLNVKQMIAVECEALARHVWINKSAKPLLSFF